MECRTALVSPSDRPGIWFVLSEGQAGDLDSRPRCDGRSLSCQCSAMRKSPLLRGGTAFLLAAGYVALSGFRLVPMRPGIFLNVILAVAVLACLAEIPFGKYRKST